MAAVEIVPARFPEDHAAVEQLMREYVGSLGVDLGFQSISAELASLPGDYTPPGGVMILRARRSDPEESRELACVALRPRGAGASSRAAG